MTVSWPILRNSATRALSRKQLPQHIPPAPGVICALFIASLRGGARGFVLANERLPGGEFAGDIDRVGNRGPEMAEILVHVAGEAIGDVAGEVRIFIGQNAEAEVLLVESVDKLAHIFDPLAERRAVIGKASGR